MILPWVGLASRPKRTNDNDKSEQTIGCKNDELIKLLKYTKKK